MQLICTNNISYTYIQKLTAYSLSNYRKYLHISKAAAPYATESVIRRAPVYWHPASIG